MIGSKRHACVEDTCKICQTAKIRQLNDELRRFARSGVICITGGVRALGPQGIESVMLAVRDFDAFKRENDPYGEHDFGALRASGVRILWKIDYYDQNRRSGSPDPADPEVTCRVLTIMLASEY